MAKEIDSFNLDKKLKTRLNQEVDNKSALVNDLLQRYFWLRDDADKGEVRSTKIRLEKIKEEIPEKKQKRKELRNELSEIENEITALEQEKETLLEELQEKEVSKDRIVKQVADSSFGGVQ